MGGRIGHVSVVVLVLALLGAGAPVLAQGVRAMSSAGVSLGSGVSAAAAGQSRYDGRLGVMFSARLDADGRAVTRIDGDGLTVVKTATAFGEVEIVVSFSEDRVELSLGPNAIRVRRGPAQATLNPKRLTEADLAGAERVIRGSRAIRAFKQLTAQIEFTDAPDDGFTLGALVDGALVRILDGEVGVVHRLGHRLRAQRRARVRPASLSAVRSQFPDCWGEYELTVDGHMDTFIECVDDAGDASWYLQSLLAAGCEFDWVMRAETAAFQYLACAAVPIR